MKTRIARPFSRIHPSFFFGIFGLTLLMTNGADAQSFSKFSGSATQNQAIMTTNVGYVQPTTARFGIQSPNTLGIRGIWRYRYDSGHFGTVKFSRNGTFKNLKADGQGNVVAAESGQFETKNLNGHPGTFTLTTRNSSGRIIVYKCTFNRNFTKLRVRGNDGTVLNLTQF